MKAPLLRAPFPWFGGKSRVAPLVWERFGDVRNYVEPFAGSLAVLLGRPTPPKVETVNDVDAFLCNFWRALAADPQGVAHHANYPVNETDLHARHKWLIQDGRPIVEKLIDDPEFYDVRVAGWWVWGLCAWIGSGWCKPIGAPHSNGTRKEADWRLRPDLSAANGRGMLRYGKRPLITGNGHGAGVHSTGIKRMPKSKPGGVHRKRPAVANEGRGVNRIQLPQLSGDGSGGGRGVRRHTLDSWTLEDYMIELAARLRRVRVCCGDFTRVITPAVTTTIGLTGVLLDPPYHAPGKERSVCYNHDETDVWGRALTWALENGNNPKLRIALCGYQGDHDIPSSWDCVEWKSGGGYGRSARGRTNARRERIWFSPHCIKPEYNLFAAGAE